MFADLTLQERLVQKDGAAFKKKKIKEKKKKNVTKRVHACAQRELRQRMEVPGEKRSWRVGL